MVFFLQLVSRGFEISYFTKCDFSKSDNATHRCAIALPSFPKSDRTLIFCFYAIAHPHLFLKSDRTLIFCFYALA
ncbi:hypothetical protein [Floridanema aerugineum]|uniref:Uncharacterized protein n=1 Tax=Floridaenema aerugineum BLCC-F46 TaxID=3153654 RepID=A0ABV4WYC9_9CYAN